MLLAQKSKLIYATLISLAVALLIGILVLIIGWPETLQKTEISFYIFRYSLFDALIYSIIPLEIGSIVYIASIFNRELIPRPEFSLATAVTNYILMLFEAISIAAVFAFGDFKWLNLILVYLMFGFQLFSYPIRFIDAIIRFLTVAILPAIFILLTGQSFSLISYFFNSGFILVAGIIAAVIVTTARYFFFQKEQKNQFAVKYLLLVLVLMVGLVVLPAVIDYMNSFIYYRGVGSDLVGVILFFALVISQAWSLTRLVKFSD